MARVAAHLLVKISSKGAGKYTLLSVGTSVQLKGGHIPMKRAKDLFAKIVSDDNLSMAIDEVNRTHHWKKGHRPNRCTAWVEETKPERIDELRQIIANGFEQKKPRITRRYDTSAKKWRKISEPVQWPDQYVHHALIQILQPVMMRGMDHYCCGSIRGRGPHQAKKAIESWMSRDYRGTKHEFCADIRHFYDSLKPEVVMDRMKRLIKDYRALDLIWRIIKNGVLIGAYTSQWFANTVLQPLDTLIRQSGLCKHYVRYMDNLTIFGPNKRNLRKLKGIVEEWLNEHGLALKYDWQIFPTTKKQDDGYRLPDAVGYRYGRDYTIPRKHNLIRMKRAIAQYRKDRSAGKSITPRRASGILSRLGQLKHCNNYQIYKSLFGSERIISELKHIIRKSQQEVMTWNMYLEQRRRQKYSGQKVMLTAS